MESADCFTYSLSEGLIEFAIDLGDDVREGDLLACVYPTDRLGLDPAEYRAGTSGVLAARHFPGLVKVGDCVAVVAKRGAR
jgi:N-alpha-acetyl-L-2,4-diaminobutyrate deacetylase